MTGEIGRRWPVAHGSPVDGSPLVEVGRRPFGIGVLAVPAGMDQALRSGERLAVAMAAYRAGYYLLDMFEIDVSDGGCGEDAVARLSVLARRTDAGAIFVRGPVDRALLGPIAEEVRMVIREVNGTSTATTTVQTPDSPG